MVDENTRVDPGVGDQMDRGVTLQDMLSHRTGMLRHDYSGIQRDGGVSEMVCLPFSNYCIGFYEFHLRYPLYVTSDPPQSCEKLSNTTT
jgi:hypothetical protein